MNNFVPVIKFFLKKTFDIREGEFTRALLMLLYIFLIISALLILKPAVTSLFLSEFGVEQLPNAFVIIALTAAIMTTIYTRYLRIYTLDKIIRKTLIFFIASLFIFWILILGKIFERWAIFIFYIWVAIFAVLSASQFWVLANVIFNSREAKRLFGFIGAGAIGGGIFGGYLTSILATFIGSENLLIICMLFLGMCIKILNFLWRNNVTPVQLTLQQKKRVKSFSEHPFFLIKKSKHLTYLASIVAVSVVIAKLVDFQFSAIASAEITDADELTAFFGFWFSNINIISLLIQLFLTRRVVGVLGVGASLFFLPGGILIGAAAILISPSLWSAILIKLSDGSLKQSINRSGVELLALPIPVSIKNQTKSFIDIFVDSFATGIGGIILIILSTGLDISIRFLSIGIIIILIFWFYIAFKVRQEYIKSFKIKIESEKKEEKDYTPNLADESVLGGIKKVLETGNEKQLVPVLRMIRDVQNESLFPAISALIHHQSNEVKLEALQNLYFFKSKISLDEIESLIKIPNRELRIEAIEYLFAYDFQGRVARVKKYLEHSDYEISAAALLGIANEVRDNLILKNLLNLDGIVKKIISDNITETNNEKKVYLKIVSAQVIGFANLQNLYPQLKELLNDETSKVVSSSIIAAGKTFHPEFVPTLIQFLGEEEFSEYAVTSISHYGEIILPKIREALKEENYSLEIKRKIPQLLGKIADQQSVNILFQSLDIDDITIRNESLKVLNEFKKSHPQLKFNHRDIIQKIHNESSQYLDHLSVFYTQFHIGENDIDSAGKTPDKSVSDARKSLIDVLEKRLDLNLERIFRLLGLKYPPDDMLYIYRGLHSDKQDLRINALEFLDNLLEINLKRILLPLIENAVLSPLSDEVFDNLKVKIPSEYECLDLLARGNDLKLQIASLYLIYNLEDPQYKLLLNDLTQHENPKVQNLAEKAILRLSS